MHAVASQEATVTSAVAKTFTSDGSPLNVEDCGAGWQQPIWTKTALPLPSSAIRSYFKCQYHTNTFDTVTTVVSTKEICTTCLAASTAGKLQSGNTYSTYSFHISYLFDWGKAQMGGPNQCRILGSIFCAAYMICLGWQLVNHLIIYCH